MVAQPFGDVATTEADTRPGLEVWNHLALCVAMDRFGADCEDGGEFAGGHQPLRIFQMIDDIGPDGRVPDRV